MPISDIFNNFIDEIEKAVKPPKKKKKKTPVKDWVENAYEDTKEFVTPPSNKEDVINPEYTKWKDDTDEKIKEGINLTVDEFNQIGEKIDKEINKSVEKLSDFIKPDTTSLYIIGGSILLGLIVYQKIK